MYRYDEIDATLVAERVAQFRDQTRRFLEGTLPEDIQKVVYDVGRRPPYTTTQKDGSVGVAQTWFNMLYQVLLGEERGPRFGSFAALFGVQNTRTLIGKALKGELTGSPR